MKSYLPIFTALATSLISNAFVPTLKADTSDRKTIISISQPITVNGTMLPAGTYVLKLQDVASGRDVVQIFNGQGTHLITTVLAMHAYRLDAADKSDFSFYGAPAGEPAALRTWFYPGDTHGLEFFHSQHPASGEPVAAGN